MAVKPSLMKKREKPRLKLGRSFWTLVEVIVVLVFAFIVLSLYLYVLTGRIENIKKEIRLYEGKRDLSLEKEIKRGLLKLGKARPLLENHRSLSPVLTFLEKNTLPTVRLSTFMLEGNNLTISASSLTYFSLIEQIAIYKSQDEVENVKLAGVSSGDLGPTVTLEISFLPEKILKYFTISPPKPKPQ